MDRREAISSFDVWFFSGRGRRRCPQSLEVAERRYVLQQKKGTIDVSFGIDQRIDPRLALFQGTPFQSSPGAILLLQQVHHSVATGSIQPQVKIDAWIVHGKGGGSSVVRGDHEPQIQQGGVFFF